MHFLADGGKTSPLSGLSSKNAIFFSTCSLRFYPELFIRIMLSQALDTFSTALEGVWTKCMELGGPFDVPVG